MRTIEIDEQVYRWLESLAAPFVDTPNSVLRTVAGFEGETTGEEVPRRPSKMCKSPLVTPQAAFREPILRVLAKLGHTALRPQVLNKVGKMVREQLTPSDCLKDSAGVACWQAAVVREAYAMRAEGLLDCTRVGQTENWRLTIEGVGMTYGM
ncbi:MAG: hypothetical protein FPO08_10960 [Geobacter sp.]|nr:MAG: hypothetical protein FPO08_10960 [Geobacter sp.]